MCKEISRPDPTTAQEAAKIRMRRSGPVRIRQGRGGGWAADRTLLICGAHGPAHGSGEEEGSEDQ